MQEQIVADLKESYGIIFDQITPVSGGFMNLKWKIRTEQGKLLVKQYSTKRFGKEKMARIECALQRQLVLEKSGILSPHLWQHGGRVIRRLDAETVYMVMNFCPGKTETPGTITAAQMRSLGSACAAMHRAFSALPPPTDKGLLPTFGGFTQESLWESFSTRMEKCQTGDPAEYRDALLALRPILRRLAPGFFDKFPKGYAHEDFHAGNILFGMDCVSAILDFDRNCYSYPAHDIGRAILSFALEGDRLNPENVRAFREGYAEHLPLTLPDIADALRLAWCIETEWWIEPKYFSECDEIARRFRDEMLWLTEHWFEMDILLSPAGR